MRVMERRVRGVVMLWMMIEMGSETGVGLSVFLTFTAFQRWMGYALRKELE